MDEADIILKLTSVEELLLDSVTNRDSLLIFDAQWTCLQTDIERARALNQLQSSTIDMIETHSSRVAIISNTVMDMISTSDQLGESMLREASTILGRAGFPETTSSSHLRSSSSTSFKDGKRHPCPPYIASAYKWLQHNFHKPYPTSEDVQKMCTDSNTSEKRIRDWFVTARKRMGWTKIAKEYFHGDREDTADAAYRVLVEPDPKRPPLDPKLQFEFVKMQTMGENMYAAAFKPSRLAGGLATAVQGMSTEHQARIAQMKQQILEEENTRKEEEHKMKRQRATKSGGSSRRSVSLYPSPERSQRSSPEPTPVLSEREDDVPPKAAAGRKRRRSSSSSRSDVSSDERVEKRTRLDVDPSTTVLASLEFPHIIL